MSISRGADQVKQISENLGFEVEGIDLKTKPSEQQMATIYHASIRHKVLIFKKIGLNQEQQVTFTREPISKLFFSHR